MPDRRNPIAHNDDIGLERRRPTPIDDGPTPNDEISYQQVTRS